MWNLAAGDSQVTWTNDHASIAKLWSVQLGYYKDPYLKVFVTTKNTPRPPPEMNVGNFMRTSVIFNEMSKFDQILNLGAGFDTSYFRLRDLGDLKFRHVIDVDLPSVICSKASMINSSKRLFGVSMDQIKNGCYRSSDKMYYLMECDLQNPEKLIELVSAHIDLNKSLLIVTECVLSYLPEPYNQNLLSSLSRSFPFSNLISYDHINMNDCFGQRFLSALSIRGIEVPGMADSAEELTARFEKNGWEKINVKLMFEVFEQQQWPVPPTDRCPLDGMDIVKQLYSHYCFLKATSTGVGRLLPLDSNMHRKEFLEEFDKLKPI